MANSMHHMKSARTKSDPWAALDALMKSEPEPTGPGWFTVDQCATRYGISIPGAQQRLNKMLSAGTVKRWKGVTASTRRVTTKWRLA